jgi:hypothetical protein
MGLLNEKICSAYQAAIPSKTFTYLPDITDSSLPSKSAQIVNDIQAKAGGRHIIFMGGAIAGKKNLASWYELIRLADPKQWYFVQIGKIYHEALTPHDRQMFEEVSRHPPENLYLKDEYLSDEKIFNQVIATAHIIFAVYRDFTISSNMLGKAAAFNKPIVVAEGHLMAERVERYRLGCAVPEHDVSKMLQALYRLINQIPAQSFSFESYRQDFSVEKLKLQFLSLVDRHLADINNYPKGS